MAGYSLLVAAAMTAGFGATANSWALHRFNRVAGASRWRQMAAGHPQPAFRVVARLSMRARYSDSACRSRPEERPVVRRRAHGVRLGDLGGRDRDVAETLDDGAPSTVASRENELKDGGMTVIGRRSPAEPRGRLRALWERSDGKRQCRSLPPRSSRVRHRARRRASRGGRRTAGEKTDGLLLDELLLGAGRGGAPDGEAAVAVVVIEEHHERLLAPDDRVGEPWLSRSVTSGRLLQMRRTCSRAAAAVASLYTSGGHRAPVVFGDQS